MLYRRAGILALTGSAALLTLAAPALAAPATVTRSGGVLTVTGDTSVQAGEPGNHIRAIEIGGQVIVREMSEDHVSPTPLAGCTPGPGGINCGAADTLTSLVYNLTPGDDRVSYDFNNPTLMDVPRTIFGGGGDDAFKGSLAVDDIDGGSGNDTIAGLAGADALAGGEGDDHIEPGCTGDDLAPEPFGGDCPGDGSDTVSGGAGVDGISYWNTSAAVTVTLGAGGAETTGNGSSGDGDKVAAIENVEGTREAANTVNGNELANDIDGSSFVDTISSGGGDDVIYSGENFDNTPLYFDANDVIDGDPGSDRVDYERLAGVRITLPEPGSAPSTGNGGGTESDSIVNVEDVLAGTDVDTLTGNSLANRIDAGPGDDTIDARAGDDQLTAGGGDDTVTAGGGNDTLDLDDDEADTAACGEGNDSVLGDADLDVLTDCETAIDGHSGDPFGGGNPNPNPNPGTTTGGGTSSGGGTPTGGGAPAAGGAASPFAGFTAFNAGVAGVNAFKAVATRTGRATVPPAAFDAYGFICAQACDGTVSGTLTAGAGKATVAKVKPLKLKPAKFKGGPGAPVRVRVKLPAKAVRLVKKRKRATLKLVTVVRSGGKSARLPATIRLKTKR